MESALSGPIFHDPRFDALRNAMYHTERASFLGTINRLFNFAVIVLGASVAAKAADKIKFSSDISEIGVVIFSTLQLVFDFGGRANQHKFLQKQYYELISNMEDERELSLETKMKWSARLLTISSDEPMTMRALDAIAYNNALFSIYSDPTIISDNQLHIPWIKKRFRNFFSFYSAVFVTEQAQRSRPWWKRPLCAMF